MDQSGVVIDSPVAERSGVLLIGHGTRDPAGTDQFFQLGDLLACRLAPAAVQPCFLELQSPTIAQGWQRLTDAGVAHVHAVPLLLFAAGHAKADIPEALARCQQQTPQISWSCARPLSRCPELLQLVIRRLDEVLHSDEFDPAETALVMVGRGSHDVCAQSDMKLLSRCVAIRRPLRRVATAFYAMAEPKLTAVLDEVAADRRIRHVIVQPHLLFDGVIHRAIGGLAAQSQARHPHCRHWCAQYLGPEPELAAALVRRITESTYDKSVAAGNS